MSVFVALQEKVLPFQMITLDPGRRRTVRAGRLQRRRSRSGCRRWSTAISRCPSRPAIDEYLEDVYPGAPLYPSEPRAAPAAPALGQIQAWLRSDLGPIRQETVD